MIAILPLFKLLPYERWPKAEDRWGDLFGLTAKLHSLDIDDKLRQRLLFWLLDRRMEYPLYYLNMFLDYCQALCVAAKNLSHKNLEMREATLIAFDFMKCRGFHCPDDLLDIGSIIVLVSTISGVDINTLSSELFAKTPQVPDDFDCAPYVITPLRSINVCMEHGLAASQCFEAPETAINYGAGACALYKVSHWSGCPVGTIGCVYDPSAAEVGVWEFKGINNQTNVDIESLSTALAESFSRPEHLAKFASYTEAVSAFRVMSGARG